ncbi:hypothetical protein GC163_01435 [bacterium]|nr:hypothetical protein [bacterium]
MKRWHSGTLLLGCGLLGCEINPPLSPTEEMAEVSAMVTEAPVDEPITAEMADEEEAAILEGDDMPSPELEAIPANVREELDLFAFATLQIQRVKLLQEGSLQRRLKLTTEQIKVLSGVNQEVQALSKTLQALKPEEREQKLRNEYRPKAAEFQALVDEQLNDEQERELFRDVVRRQRGAITFLLPGVPEELSLTDTQKAKLYAMIEATRQAVDFDNLYNPLVLAKLISRANAARKQALEQLTPVQRAKFDALIGD